MAHFVGLDVSVKETSVCVVDDAGKVILEQKVLTEPDTIGASRTVPWCVTIASGDNPCSDLIFPPTDCPS